jgi:copper chaperone CopZ
VVKGVHLCCPSCVSAVDEALGGVQGVSNVAADRDSKLVTFTAADAKAAQAGVNALAQAGFHGAASHGKDAVPFPASGAKPGDKADAVTLAGVHLCCGACVTDAQKALADLDGVSVIDIDRNAATIKLSGSEIDVPAAVKALNAGGFHATIKPAK